MQCPYCNKELKVIFHIYELSKWKLLLKNVINLLDALDIEKFHIGVLELINKQTEGYAYLKP